MTRVRTQSGSTYEVDDDKVRRINGPESRITEEWRAATVVSVPVVGARLCILWGDDVAPLVEGTEPFAKMTVTSPVVEVVEC